LTCITCNPSSSSRWQREYQHIYGIDIRPFHFYKKDFVQDFIDYAPDIIHLDIPGGEPFLSGVPEQKQLLEHFILTGQSKNISLHYTTNVTVYPDSSWWELWKHFKEIDMQLSVDGIGARYEYIRYPAKWNEVSVNTARYIKQEQTLDNFRLSVSHTVSAYNIYYLEEFFEWCYAVGLPRPWLGRVHAPVHMQPTVWSSSAKQFIYNKLSTSKNSDVQTWANLVKNSQDSDQFNLFCTRVRDHDQYRGLSFNATFPELHEWIK
jgi:hypothetical protein